MVKEIPIPVTLEDILAAREARRERQKAFQNRHGVTLNMPGAVKDSAVLRKLLDYAVREIKKSLTVAALQAGGMGSALGREMIASLDDEFIAGNVSPGGSADLLAVAWFLHKIGLAPIPPRGDRRGQVNKEASHV